MEREKMLIKIDIDTNAKKTKDKIFARAIFNESEMARVEDYAKEHNINMADLLLCLQTVVNDTFQKSMATFYLMTFDNLLANMEEVEL